MAKPRYSVERLHQARDYAINEPSFTAAFMAWEKGWEVTSSHAIVNELFRLGIIVQIESRKGPYAAVYTYNAVERAELPVRVISDGVGAVPGVGVEAPHRGVPVPHVTPQGPSGRPGWDRKRQERGVTVKRHRQGT